MSNGIAIVLVAIIAAASVADLTLNGGSALLFLSRKGIDLIEMIAIWR